MSLHSRLVVVITIINGPLAVPLCLSLPGVPRPPRARGHLLHHHRIIATILCHSAADTHYRACGRGAACTLWVEQCNVRQCNGQSIACCTPCRHSSPGGMGSRRGCRVILGTIILCKQSCVHECTLVAVPPVYNFISPPSVPSHAPLAWPCARCGEGAAMMLSEGDAAMAPRRWVTSHLGYVMCEVYVIFVVWVTPSLLYGLLHL